VPVADHVSKIAIWFAQASFIERALNGVNPLLPPQFVERFAVACDMFAAGVGAATGSKSVRMGKSFCIFNRFEMMSLTGVNGVIMVGGPRDQ
jgi:hypothetical protein